MTAKTLSQILREGSADVHQEAESNPFVSDILAGSITRLAYCYYVRSLCIIYSALERQLDANSADPVIEHVFFPLELWRSDALESDFDYLAGDERDAICHREFGAAKRYASHLDKLGEASPSLLLAHAYTRYLGDLSGGQILKKHIKDALALPDERGVSFYDFPQIQNIYAFKKTFKAGIDAAAEFMSEEAKDEMREEVRKGFEMTMDVMNEVLAYISTTTTTTSATGNTGAPVPSASSIDARSHRRDSAGSRTSSSSSSNGAGGGQYSKIAAAENGSNIGSSVGAETGGTFYQRGSCTIS